MDDYNISLGQNHAAWMHALHIMTYSVRMYIIRKRQNYGHAKNTTGSTHFLQLVLKSNVANDLGARVVFYLVSFWVLITAACLFFTKGPPFFLAIVPCVSEDGSGCYCVLLPKNTRTKHRKMNQLSCYFCV